MSEGVQVIVGYSGCFEIEYDQMKLLLETLKEDFMGN